MAPSDGDACVTICTGHDCGCVPGNLRRITVRDVITRGARGAVMGKAEIDGLQVEDCQVS